MNDISRALTNEHGFIKFSAVALGECRAEPRDEFKQPAT